MIYGYETPVDMPVPELYDTGLMRDYINSVQTMYEKGEKQLDDYYSKYGDFTSPFKKDVENYDKLTLVRLNNKYDELVAQGIDPLRTPEGRAAMSAEIRKTPVATLQNMQQSAETGRDYLKAIQQLKLSDKYDQGFEDFLLRESGIGNFEDYDTMKNGTWERNSPGVYQTLGKAVDNWYEGMKPTDKGKKGGYRWTGIDENDLINVARPKAQAFANTALGRYEKSLVRDRIKAANPNATDQEINDATDLQFLKDIAATQKKRLIMTPEADPYDMLAVKDMYDARSQRRAARLKAADAGDNTQQAYPASFKTVIDRFAVQSQDNRIVDNARNIASSKYRYYSNIMSKNKAGSKAYNEAKKYRDWWSKAYNDPSGMGLVKNGKPTDFLTKKYAEYTQHNLRTDGSSRKLSAYMNAYTHELPDVKANRTLKNALAGETTVIPGTTLKHRVVDFGTSRAMPSSYKISTSVGYGHASRVQGMFKQWLKANNIRGYMTGGKVRVDRNTGSTTSGVNNYYTDVYIPQEEFARFYNYYKEHATGDKPLSERAVMKNLGVTIDTTSVYKNDEGKRTNLPMYKFSTAFTVGDNVLDSVMNTEYDKQMYGVSNAYNLAPNRQAEALAKQLGLE